MAQKYFQSMPTYDQALEIQGKTSSVWYRFFVSLFQGQPSASETMITVGASPFIFTAPVGGWVIISGGTISAMSFARSLTTVIPAAENIIPLANGDQLTITYSVAPVVTFVPGF